MRKFHCLLALLAFTGTTKAQVVLSEDVDPVMRAQFTNYYYFSIREVKYDEEGKLTKGKSAQNSDGSSFETVLLVDKDTITHFELERGATIMEDNLYGKEVEFIVISRDYETLREKIKIESRALNIFIFLTPKKEDD